MDEMWRPIPSKPGMMASSLGRVRLPERTAKLPRCDKHRAYTTKPFSGTVMFAKKGAKHSYLGMSNKHFGTMKIHRLVCEAFHGPSPFPKAVVIHINENAHDNRPENLKWGTQKENLNALGFIEYCKARKGLNSPFVKGKIRKETELLALLGET